jgi:large subunit ribosomal protein L34e
MTQPNKRNRKRRKKHVRTPGNVSRVHHAPTKPGKAVDAMGNELHGIPRKTATRMKNTPKSKKRPERPFGGQLTSASMREHFTTKARVDDEPVGGDELFPIGRLCMKTAGRDAGNHCVVIGHDDGRVLIDGATRRRHVNPSHLEPMATVLDVAEDASHDDVRKAFDAHDLDARGPSTSEDEDSENDDITKEMSDDSSSDEIPSRSSVERMTKDEIKAHAADEYGIELSTNDLKDEMIDQFFDELE